MGRCLRIGNISIKFLPGVAISVRVLAVTSENSTCGSLWGLTEMPYESEIMKAPTDLRGLGGEYVSQGCNSMGGVPTVERRP